MPTSQVLSDLDSKLKWAEKHLRELNDLLGRWRLSQPDYRITKHDEPLIGHHVVRMYSFPYAPSDIPLLLSDFVYATRTALDHLAWQLSRKTLPIPPPTVMFPIHASSDPKSEKRFRERTVGMPADAVTEIRALQPYHRATTFRDDPLWKLNELSNIDKHRIFALSSNTAHVFAKPDGYSVRPFDNGCEFRWPLSRKHSVVFEPYATQFIFGKPVDLPGDPFEVGQAELAEIHGYVRDNVIPRFTRFFP